MKNKVVIITSEQEEFKRKVGKYDLPDLEIVAPGSEEVFEEELKDANIIFGNPFTFQKYLDKAPKLVWAQSTFAGIDALCKQGGKRDYMLTNVKDAYGEHMSEYVFGYILMMEKRILEGLQKQKDKYWKREAFPTISGKNIVILGTGSIGKVIAKVAQSFGMKTLGYNISGKEAEYFDEIYTPESKKACFEQADYLVSVLPDTPDTRNTINSEALGWMKNTSVLINVGRGHNVDEEALVEALEKKHIAAAVLDVFQTEPLPTDHPFWTLENVFVTSHVSGYVEDNSRLVEIFANNYKKFHAGEQLDYKIDFERGF